MDTHYDFNVSGKIFTVGTKLLLRSHLLKNQIESLSQVKATYIPRDPVAFHHIIELLKDPNYDFPARFNAELDFYGIDYQQLDKSRVKVISIDVGTKNLSLCGISATGEPVEWEVIDMVQGKKLKQTEICDSIVNTLSSIKWIHSAAGVVIEQQEVTNVQMRVVCYCLYMYFKTRSPERKVITISAKNKYKATPLTDEERFVVDHGTYYGRKKISYPITLRLLNGLNNSLQYINLLNSHPKKDDLCDAYLQGIYTLNNMDFLFEEPEEVMRI